MSARLAAVVVVLGAGAVTSGALYWGLLNTPEANVLMLTASLLLALAIVAIAAITVNTCVFIARGAPLGHAIRAGSHGTGWFVLAIAPVLLAWWAVGRAHNWVLAHQGEINAWFIAHFDMPDISALLAAERWSVRWVQWAVLPVIALSLLTYLLTRDEKRQGWLRHALGWQTLGAATIVFLLTATIPGRLVEWRPELPPTWVEPAVAALRIGTAILLALVAAAVMIVLSSRQSAAAND